MATTVNILGGLGVLSANPSRTLIGTGDTITFTAGETADCALFFSPGARAILEPTPDASGVILNGGASVTFIYTLDDPGQYCVFVQGQQLPPPPLSCGQSDNSSFLSIAIVAVTANDIAGPDDPPDQVH